MYCFPLTLILVSWMSVTTAASESLTEPPFPDLKNRVVAGPYCGIYSLYACLDVFGKNHSLLSECQMWICRRDCFIFEI